MQHEVQILCSNIDRRDSANMLIFISFHTESEVIINTLVEKLNGYFSAAQEFDFSVERTAPVNELVFDIPKQIVDSSSFEKNRNKRLDAEDKVDFVEAKEEPVRRQGPAAELYLTLTATEILGNIIRNHYAKLDAKTKKVIFNSATGAALRFLGSMFDELAGSLDATVIAISSYSDRFLTEESTAKRKTAAKHLVFFLVVVLISIGVIQIVRSIGDENLEITYKQAIEDCPTKVRKFIDLAIKLGHFREFPLEDLRDVVSELEYNKVGMAALQLFVAERLDMRPPGDRRILQRICDAAKISLAPRLIERQKSGAKRV